jgi:serine/threonine-protein kinase
LTVATPRLAQLAAGEVARVSALLDEALTLDETQRAAWRSALPQREPALAPLVHAMLDALLTRAPPETGELIARALAGAAASADRVPGLEGRLVGPYRVLSLLGRGGMGSVWLARRDDGLVERPLALKLLHPSLVGQAAMRRFVRERTILGALDHPNIARLLDAGLTPEGQPWLALEAVEGEPIDAHAERLRLDPRARVRLMLQVLAAVQYAHQALVVHRDLKPANILVTAAGQVRLLDFGIAKLMSEGRAEETEITQLAGRALTPEYASPEQLGGRAVGTASDVYALGVLLYRLLCGQRPYALERGAPAAAYERAIAERPPLPPSQQAIDAETAAARAGTPKKLAQALAGDLDTIVLAALKADPAERYATADAMRQDLERWLEGRPVLARPTSRAYRLRKFAQRHRWRLAGAGALAALLLGATAVSLTQARAAREQAQRAQQEQQRAQAAQRFLQDVFTANSVHQADPQRARLTTARELLDKGAERITRSLADAPQQQAELLDMMADMYWQLGLQVEAGRLRRQRIDTLQALHGAADVRVAQAWLAHARDLADTQQRAQAPASLEQARRILDAAGDQRSEARGQLWMQSAELQQYLSVGAMRADADRALAHFSAYPAGWNLFRATQAAARARYMAGEFEAALPLHHRALAEAAARQGPDTAWAVTPLVQVAEAEANLMDLAAAEQHMRRALALSRRLNGPLGGASLQTQAKLAALLYDSGRRDEGLALLDELQAALARPDANATPNAVAAFERTSGIVLVAEGRFARGEKPLAAEVADLREHYPDSIPLSRSLLLQAQALTALGRYDASAAAVDEATDIWQRRGSDAVRPATWNRYHLERARLLVARGRAEAALQALGQMAAPGPQAADRIDHARAQLLRGQAWLQQRQWGDAEGAAASALQALDGTGLRPRLPVLEADAHLLLGRALHGAGRTAQARGALEAALALRQAHGRAGSIWLAEVQIALAEAWLDLNAPRRAAALLAQARAAHAAEPELGAHFSAPLMRVQARVQARAQARAQAQEHRKAP